MANGTLLRLHADIRDGADRRAAHPGLLEIGAVLRLLPIGVIAVVLNVFTGMLMLLADTYRYVVNDYTFAPKIAFIPIGATAVLYFSLSDRLWKLKAGEDAPAFAKAVAILVLVCWAGVIACGRLLPYL